MCWSFSFGSMFFGAFVTVELRSGSCPAKLARSLQTVACQPGHRTVWTAPAYKAGANGRPQAFAEGLEETKVAAGSDNAVVVADGLVLLAFCFREMQRLTVKFLDARTPASKPGLSFYKTRSSNVLFKKACLIIVHDYSTSFMECAYVFKIIVSETSTKFSRNFTTMLNNYVGVLLSFWIYSFYFLRSLSTRCSFQSHCFHFHTHNYFIFSKHIRVFLELFGVV